MLGQADALLGTARKAMAEQGIHQALAAILRVVAEANRYFAGAGAVGAEARPIRRAWRPCCT